MYAKITHLVIICGTLCVGISGLSQSQASEDPKVKAILAQLQASLSKVQTLKFSSRLDIQLSPERQAKIRARVGSSPSVLSNKLVYLSKGARYRAEVSLSEGQPPVILAYDGTCYQMLRDSVLSIGKTNTQGPNLYGTTHPIIRAFSFAFCADDMRSIPKLQAAETWSRLADTALTSEDAEMFGHSGVKVTFSRTAPCSNAPVTYEVFFASDLNYFPLFWSLVYADGHRSESRVLSTKSFDQDGTTVIIPTRIAASESTNSISESSILEIDIATLKVNEPVDDSVFIIDRSTVEHIVDSDTGLALEP